MSILLLPDDNKAASFKPYYKNINIYTIKRFFLDNIVTYEARGQVIFPEGR